MLKRYRLLPYEQILILKSSASLQNFTLGSALMKRVQVMMKPECHRALKQLAAYYDTTMSDLMCRFARAQISTLAKQDDHILKILQSEGIEVDECVEYLTRHPRAD